MGVVLTYQGLRVTLWLDEICERWAGVTNRVIVWIKQLHTVGNKRVG